MYCSLFLHSSIGCVWIVSAFGLLWIVLWIFVYKFCLNAVFCSFKYIPQSRVAESLGNSMFRLLRNQQTVFQSGCIILHSLQPCRRVPTSPHPCQHLLSIFFESSYPNGCKAVSHCDPLGFCTKHFLCARWCEEGAIVGKTDPAPALLLPVNPGSIIHYKS